MAALQRGPFIIKKYLFVRLSQGRWGEKSTQFNNAYFARPLIPDHSSNTVNAIKDDNNAMSLRFKCTLEQREEERVRKMLLILSVSSPSIALLNWKLLAVKYHRIS